MASGQQLSSFNASLCNWFEARQLPAEIVFDLKAANAREAASGATSRFTISALQRGISILQNTEIVKDSEVDELFVSLLTHVAAADFKEDFVAAIVEIIAALSKERSDFFRLTQLVNLYNRIPRTTDNSIKLNLFRTVLDFATSTKQLNELKTFLSSISTWDIPKDQITAFHLYIANCYKQCGDLVEEQNFLGKYLSEVTSLTDPATIEAAKAAAVNFLKSPVGGQNFEVPRYAAVKTLASIPQYSKLYELVDIFATKNVAAFQSWMNSAENKQYLNFLGVDYESSLQTIRVFTVCSVTSKFKTVTYENLASELQCGVEEVESWVIRAVVSGLIDAKLDQIKKVVTVTRSSERVIDSDSWEKLQNTLNQWDVAVKSILESIKN